MTTAGELASAGVVGFRFHPTDEELIDHYMRLKMLGWDEEVSKFIRDIENICEFEPWELRGLSPINSKNNTSWYFFCLPDYKYTKGKRLNRATKKGSWKVTGRDRTIKARGKEIGMKRTLVFHENNKPKPKPTKTKWIIHEYHSKVTYRPNQREIVLCHLKYKHDDTTDISSSDGGEWSHQRFPPDLEDEDIIMGEEDYLRLAEIESQLQFIIDHPNQSPSFEISDELLRQMYETPVSERPQVFVNSFTFDQVAALFEETSSATMLSLSNSSSRGWVHRPRFSDYEVNHMLEPQGGFTAGAQTNRSQYRAQSETFVASGSYELQANFGDLSDDFAPSIMVLDGSEPHELIDSSTSDDEPKSKKDIAVKSPVKRALKMHSPPEVASKYKAKEAEGQGDSDDLNGSIVVDSNSSSKMAESSSSSSSKSKSPSPQPLGQFIVMEPSPLNLMQEPLSVYVFNLVIGMFLFLVFVWELMLIR